MAIKIRVAETEDELNACFGLRYQTYVDEMQRPQEFADHDRRITREPYDDYADILMAEDDGEVVATMRMSMRRRGPMECEELYNLESFAPYYPDAVGMITKFVIKPEYRQTSVAGRMALASYKFGRDNDIKVNIIDCYPHLVQLYQQMGFRFYMSNIRHPDYGSVIPMALILEDIDYFESIRSPFFRFARQYDNSPEFQGYFAARFPHYASIRPLFAANPDDLLTAFSSEVARSPEESFGFLAGLKKEEVQSLLSNLAILHYEKGEFIFRQNDESLGMFCLLKGQVEVVLENDAGASTIAILNEGDTFGEMGFVAKTRRTASILVREDAEVLVLAPTDFQKVVHVNPDIGVKFLTNLFKITVERYINVISSR